MNPVLAEAAFSLLIDILRETGILTATEAEAAKAYDSMNRFIEHLKTYDQFPTGKNGQTEDDDGT